MWDSVLKLGVGLGVSAVKGWNGWGWDEADEGVVPLRWMIWRGMGEGARGIEGGRCITRVWKAHGSLVEVMGILQVSIDFLDYMCRSNLRYNIS